MLDMANSDVYRGNAPQQSVMPKQSIAPTTTPTTPSHAISPSLVYPENPQPYNAKPAQSTSSSSSGSRSTQPSTQPATTVTPSGQYDITPVLTPQNFQQATSTQPRSYNIPSSQQMRYITNSSGQVVGVEDAGTQKTYQVKPVTVEQATQYEQTRYGTALAEAQRKSQASTPRVDNGVIMSREEGKQPATTSPYDFTVTSPIEKYSPAANYPKPEPQMPGLFSQQEYYSRIEGQIERQRDIPESYHRALGVIYTGIKPKETLSETFQQIPYRKPEETLTRLYSGVGGTLGQTFLDIVPGGYLTATKAVALEETGIRSIFEPTTRKAYFETSGQALGEIPSTAGRMYNPTTYEGVVNIGLTIGAVEGVAQGIKALTIKPADVKTDITSIESKRVVTETAVSDKMKFQIKAYTEGQEPKVYTGTAAQLYEQVKSNPELYTQFGGAKLTEAKFNTMLRGLSEVEEGKAATLTRLTGQKQPTRFVVTKTEELLPKFDTTVPGQQQLPTQRFGGESSLGTIEEGGTLQDFAVARKGVSLTKELSGYQQGGTTTQYLRTHAVSVPYETTQDVSNIFGKGLPKFDTSAPPSTGGGGLTNYATYYADELGNPQIFIVDKSVKVAQPFGMQSEFITTAKQAATTTQAAKVLPTVGTITEPALRQAATSAYISTVRTTGATKAALATIPISTTASQQKPSVLQMPSITSSISRQQSQPQQIVLPMPQVVKPISSSVTTQYSPMPDIVPKIRSGSGSGTSTVPMVSVLPIQMPDTSILPVTSPVTSPSLLPPSPVPGGGTSNLPPFGFLPDFSVDEPAPRARPKRGKAQRKKYQPSLLGIEIGKKASKGFKSRQLTGFEIRGL